MDNNLNLLIQLSKEKLAQIDLLIEDTIKQKKNIEDENIDGIEYIVKKREIIIRDVEEIDKKFLAAFNNLKTSRGINDLDELKSVEPDLIKALQDIIGNVRVKLSEAMKLDKTNMLSMEGLISDNKKGLKQVKVGQKLNNAYNPQQSGSIMINENY